MLSAFNDKKTASEAAFLGADLGAEYESEESKSSAASSLPVSPSPQSTPPTPYAQRLLLGINFIAEDNYFTFQKFRYKKVVDLGEDAAERLDEYCTIKTGNLSVQYGVLVLSKDITETKDYREFWVLMIERDSLGENNKPFSVQKYASRTWQVTKQITISGNRDRIFNTVDEWQQLNVNGLVNKFGENFGVTLQLKLNSEGKIVFNLKEKDLDIEVLWRNDTSEQLSYTHDGCLPENLKKLRVNSQGQIIGEYDKNNYILAQAFLSKIDFVPSTPRPLGVRQLTTRSAPVTPYQLTRAVSGISATPLLSPTQVTPR